MRRSTRRMAVAFVLSVLVHAAFLLFSPHRPYPNLRLGGAAGPMVVTIEEAPQPKPAPEAALAPQPVPREPPPPKPLITARPHTPRAAPPVLPPEVPKPAPTPPPPAVDMLAMINARREKRRAAEAAAARESAGIPGSQLPTEDEGLAALQRNLDSLSRDDQTGGIFQILGKSSLSAEYAFNGWRPDTRRRWREVIEVRAAPGEDIDLAIVRSMIALIRSHYTGDFYWESRRLGRVVQMSARPQDNAALEDFLLREFFGTPVIKPSYR